jgi:hypothetical protein
MTDPTKDHSRTSPQGRTMGRSTARIAELGRARLVALGLDAVKAPGLRDEMCKSCACRAGTVPNGCLTTQLDVLKCAAEGKPFYCHAPRDGRICAGWASVRAQLGVTPLPAAVVEMLAKHEYSPPDAEDA